MSIGDIAKSALKIGQDPIQLVDELAFDMDADELQALFDNPVGVETGSNTGAVSMHYGEEHDFAGAAFLGILKLEAIQRAVRVKPAPFITVHGSIMTMRTAGSC